MKIPYVFKKCSNCGEWKVANIANFCKDKSRKLGLFNRCKICEKERMRVIKQSDKGQATTFNCSNRRRQREEAQGRGITTKQWRELMDFFEWKCAYSGMNLSKGTRTIDHIIPLCKGGANEIWNLAPMYRPYNSSKRDKDMIEWYTEQDFYNEERLQKIYEWQEYAYNKYGLNDEII